MRKKVIKIGGTGILFCKDSKKAFMIGSLYWFNGAGARKVVYFV
jgi:hypothetical protein